MENSNSYLSFRIGEEYFAANVKYVHNIIEYTKITKVPEMPAYMLGIINLRGRVLPVVDTKMKFGLPPTEITASTCILVTEVEIEGKSVFVGALVDAVSEVIEIDEEEIEDPPKIGSVAGSNYLMGMYHDKEKFIMLLAMDSLFTQDEKVSVGNMVYEKQ